MSSQEAGKRRSEGDPRGGRPYDSGAEMGVKPPEPRSTRDCWSPPEGQRQGGTHPCPEPSEGAGPWGTPCFWTCSPQNCERIKVCCVSPTAVVSVTAAMTKEYRWDSYICVPCITCRCLLQMDWRRQAIGTDVAVDKGELRVWAPFAPVQGSCLGFSAWLHHSVSDHITDSLH